MADVAAKLAYGAMPRTSFMPTMKFRLGNQNTGSDHTFKPAERRSWREGCLQAGAMIATRRGPERAGAGVFFAGQQSA